jgi:hypothetical protein
MSLTDRDRRLGGKLRCPFCHGEWWVSGAEVASLEREWPQTCGNGCAVAPTFLPYDFADNRRVFATCLEAAIALGDEASRDYYANALAKLDRLEKET